MEERLLNPLLRRVSSPGLGVCGCFPRSEPLSLIFDKRDPGRAKEGLTRGAVLPWILEGVEMKSSSPVGGGVFITRRRGTIAAARSPSSSMGFRVCKGVARTDVETLRCSRGLSPAERNELGRDVEMVESVSLSSVPSMLSSCCCWSTSMASPSSDVCSSWVSCCVCLPLEVIFESKPVRSNVCALAPNYKLELTFEIVNLTTWSSFFTLSSKGHEFGCCAGCKW